MIGMVAASLASLTIGGQFVEVGKRDIWSPARIAQERPDLRSHLVAIDFWPPKTVGDHMRHLSLLFRQGEWLCYHSNANLLHQLDMVHTSEVQLVVKKVCARNIAHNLHNLLEHFLWAGPRGKRTFLLQSRVGDQQIQLKLQAGPERLQADLLEAHLFLKIDV